MHVALNSALDHAMELDDKVIIIGEDVADLAGGVLFREELARCGYGPVRLGASVADGLELIVFCTSLIPSAAAGSPLITTR